MHYRKEPHTYSTIAALSKSESAQKHIFEIIFGCTFICKEDDDIEYLKNVAAKTIQHKICSCLYKDLDRLTACVLDSGDTESIKVLEELRSKIL